MKIKYLFFILFIFTSPYLLASPTKTIMPPYVKQIQLNKANAHSLTGIIKGIGVKRAEAIVKYREQHGPFKTVEELAYVPGIGKRFVSNHLEELTALFIL